MEDALGIPPHIVGSVLNHDPKGYKGITATYTRGNLLYERRRALTAWARLLGLITDAEKWARVEKLLSPETEADAARTDEFRRMIQTDGVTWLRYVGSSHRQTRPVSDFYRHSRDDRVLLAPAPRLTSFRA